MIRRCAWRMGGAAFPAVLAGLLLVAPEARAQAKDSLDVSQIPAVVLTALKAKFPGAEIRRWTTEREGGLVLYDIEFSERGRKAEADIKEDGTYHNFERAIAASALPAAVTQAVARKYPQATLREIMEITEVTEGRETLYGYEIVLLTADRREVEVTVAPDGKVLEDSSDEKSETG